MKKQKTFAVSLFLFVVLFYITVLGAITLYLPNNEFRVLVYGVVCILFIATIHYCSQKVKYFGDIPAWIMGIKNPDKIKEYKDFENDTT